MFSTGHLSSGVAVGIAAGLDGWPLAAFVLAAVFTDWDYAIQLVTGVNHRERLLHSPLVVAAALAPLALWQPILWFVLAGSMLHFAGDLYDYGLRLNPFSKRIYGLRWLDVPPDASFGAYIRAYFTDKRFVALEATLAVAAVAALAWRGLPTL